MKEEIKVGDLVRHRRPPRPWRYGNKKYEFRSPTFKVLSIFRRSNKRMLVTIRHLTDRKMGYRRQRRFSASKMEPLPNKRSKRK